MTNLQEIERAEGIGSVFEGETKLTEVNYSLRVLQKMIDVSGMGDRSPSLKGGLKQIKGHIQPLDPQASMYSLYDKDKLILHLDDGRKLDFAVQGTGEISALGGFHD